MSTPWFPRPQIQVGDVVDLKSGGPGMAVENVYQIAGDDTWYAHCSWFPEHSRIPQSHVYALDALRKKD